MHFNLGQVVALAAVVSPAAAWDVEVFTTKDCSNGPTGIYGDTGGRGLGCYDMSDFSVNIMNIKMDYDDVQYHTIDLFQDGSCQCPLNHAHTCPAGQVIDKSCTNNIFNKKVGSWKIWLNGKGTKKRDEKTAQPFEA